MSSSRSFLRTFRRGGIAARSLVWLTCLLLSPLPVPTMHRHDEIEMPHSLAIHLTQQHGDGCGRILAMDEPHWHFSLPSQQQGDGDDHEGPSDRRANYVAGSAGNSVVSPAVANRSLDHLGSLLVWTTARAIAKAPTSRRDFALTELSVKAALEHQRCAHSCVMRC